MKPKSIEKIDFNDFFDILDHIERKPGLFLLRPNLELLYSFITGMKLASFNNNINLKNIDKFDMFHEFVHEKMKLKHKSSMSWFGAISYEYGSGTNGFNKFFEYLNEFRNE